MNYMWGVFSKFEEEDDFSDVEEDFKRFMEEAQRYKS